MAGKGFRVDPDKLAAVAARVSRLSDLVNGSRPGGAKSFSKNASDSALAEALAPFWDGGGEAVMARAYGSVYDGINQTYQSLATQLSELHGVCMTTASQYQTHDAGAKKTVAQTDTFDG